MSEVFETPVYGLTYFVELLVFVSPSEFSYTISLKTRGFILG